MSNRIITISREFGSGGRTIGRKVADRLGIPCYDQEYIERTAKESKLTKVQEKESGEHAPSISQDELWDIQRSIILELAQRGSCVIVGRCADYVARDVADCLTVFVHAAVEKRAERILRIYGESPEPPEKRLKDVDAKRRAYYQTYTDAKWGVANNYHITLDSGTFGMEKCVDIITQLF